MLKLSWGPPAALVALKCQRPLKERFLAISLGDDNTTSYMLHFSRIADKEEKGRADLSNALPATRVPSRAL